MLTVMHRHNDGSETIYEALSVTREVPGDSAAIPAYGDVIIHGVDEPSGKNAFSPYVGPGTCHEGEGRVRISSKWMDPKGFDESRIFVMNRFGATVAQHVLRLQVV